MKFRAIEALAGRYPVAPMCRLLRVSRSGFYAWQQRPPSAREMANRRLSKEIRTIHHEVNGIYGHRRIKAELAAMGHACGRHRVARLMREAGLRVRSRKRWRLVSSSRHALPIAPNHLDRQFASDRANRHWVSDMTYVRTAQGWLYLAVVLDLYSRAVVGWAMHHRMQQALVHAALEMAVARRQPKEEVLLHSDRGSQYCAYDYQALLRRHRIVPSHSRPGNCWDNAAMESFFRSLKAERVYLTRYASYQEAKKPTCSTTSAFTITAGATRRWAISVRWNLSGEMRAVALNYLSTSSGADQLTATAVSGQRKSDVQNEFYNRSIIDYKNL
ncbi:IS3 family transposase [Pseudomonas sp. zfem001]|nr:IS3 family transposase [Pseudomonas sp. zfem001]MDU9407977.1 IS3 family transposase [Pseudomonas sp. zfem001]